MEIQWDVREEDDVKYWERKKGSLGQVVIEGIVHHGFIVKIEGKTITMGVQGRYPQPLWRDRKEEL